MGIRGDFKLQNKDKESGEAIKNQQCCVPSKRKITDDNIAARILKGN